MQRFETKYDLLNAAYKDETLKKGAILLLQYLVHKANEKKCFPAVETIAKALNICKRTVQYNMRKLEKAGYIIRKDRWYHHQQLTNQYVFNLGVIEDAAASVLYTDDEKADVQSAMFCDGEDKRILNKSGEILKIYNMPLQGREKLLLTYLVHKSNRQGLCYKEVVVMMKEIGIGKRTLVKLLNRLRDKNLIKVKTIFVSGEETFLVKLTGNTYTENKSKASSRSSYIDCDKHEKQKVVKTAEATGKPEIVFSEQSVQSIPRQRSMKKRLWNKIWRKCKGMIQLGMDTVRFILRL